MHTPTRFAVGAKAFMRQRYEFLLPDLQIDPGSLVQDKACTSKAIWKRKVGIL
jgi:hypothetical protein